MKQQKIHRDLKYKFVNGYWTWKKDENELKFHPRNHQIDTENDNVKKIIDKNSMSGNFLKFKREMSEVEEAVFVKYFQRSSTDFISLKDVRNLAMFTLKTKVSNEFRSFIFSDTFDSFLHSAVFYMDYFLKVLEFLLIRRDETKEEEKVRDFRSINIERTMSRQLSHRRLLMSREYSKVIHK